MLGMCLSPPRKEKMSADAQEALKELGSAPKQEKTIDEHLQLPFFRREACDKVRLTTVGFLICIFVVLVFCCMYSQSW